MNLGWKLAATVHGYAPVGLLDTYADERHPIGAAVLDWSRAQVATMRPEPYADRDELEQAVRRWFGAPAPAGLAGGDRVPGQDDTGRTARRGPGPQYGPDGPPVRNRTSG